MKYSRSQSGVALVITLIMLSIITLIAVAFLALTQRDRASVSIGLTGLDTEAMANAGLDRAKVQILAETALFMADPANRVFTNANREWIPALTLGPDLTVSTAGEGFLTNYPTSAEYPMLAGLLIDPTPPVFTTNNARGTNRHVFYLDLNRNGEFEASGWISTLNSAGVPTGVTNYMIGDPQWIGVLARPNEPHSSSNRFIGRYAYIILPAGRTHSIDSMHNKVRPPPGNRVYNRNQGHGSWELNLAAFLSDLNPGIWSGYNYANRAGFGFADAGNILNYRYFGATLKTGRELFDPQNRNPLRSDAWKNDGIDQYADTTDGGPELPWPGSPNPRHFFSIHDFYNDTPSLRPFQTQLRTAGNSLASSNAHTFYRMLAQLGTDTLGEKPRYEPGSPNDKAPINLNYANTNDVDAADFVHWTPEGFFHTVADRLLRDYGFADNTGTNSLSVTNLQVYPTNFYTPAVHRIVQMTLNIFDATKTNRGPPGRQELPYYPTVLQPLFRFERTATVTNVFIAGYGELMNHTNVLRPDRWHDLNETQDFPSDHFVYGVPLLVGAKKGLPNFNEMVSQATAQVVRRLRVDKSNGRTVRTNQLFIIGVSNYVALEAWNSYSNPYPRNLSLYVGITNRTTLTNEDPYRLSRDFGIIHQLPIPNSGPNQWQGKQFRVPVWSNYVVLADSAYKDRTMRWPPTTNEVNWEINGFPAPQWVVTANTKMRFFLFDGINLIDAVGLAPAVSVMNITKELHNLDRAPNITAFARSSGRDHLWKTNRDRGAAFNRYEIPTEGVIKQLEISQTPAPAWDEYGQWPSAGDAAKGFYDFLRSTNITSTNQMMAPFTPQHKVNHAIHWQANDPLVHHIVEDLSPTNYPPRPFPVLNFGAPAVSGANMFDTNTAYRPWGGNPRVDQSDPSRGEAANNIAIKDPLVRSSDDWNFPTNKFPTIGWLGRVHRGTPWQTIYFKSPVADMTVWRKVPASGRSHPTNDWRLADIFTVAPYPTASRGRLSVNQTNIAAWSAVFSGIEIPELVDRPTGPVVRPTLIEPAANGGRLDQLVEAINKWRQQWPGQVFSSVSEFLTVPELTVNSPYLTLPNMPPAELSPLRDSDYEALAERILSLVKPGEPRFVVYAFGQSLKPAPQSIIPGGAYRGLCVNYEVTGELAAKAVMRVDLVPVPPPNPMPAGGWLGVRPQAVIESYNILPPD